MAADTWRRPLCWGVRPSFCLLERDTGDYEICSYCKDSGACTVFAAERTKAVIGSWPRSWAVRTGLPTAGSASEAWSPSAWA